VARQPAVGAARCDDELLPPSLFTASTTRWSSHVLMKVRLIGFCAGKTTFATLSIHQPIERQHD
jgi:hypothetical protein